MAFLISFVVMQITKQIGVLVTGQLGKYSRVRLHESCRAIKQHMMVLFVLQLMQSPRCKKLGQRQLSSGSSTAMRCL